MTSAYTALAAEYALLWTRMTVKPQQERAVDAAARRLLRDLRMYAAPSVATGVPIPVLMCITEWMTGGRTDWNVMTGKPLYDGETFEQGAVAAASSLDFDEVKGWSICRALYELERSHSFEYRDKHQVRSPHLWGATTHTQTVTVPGTSSARIGMAPILRRIMELDRTLLLPLGTDDMPPLGSGQEK